MWPIYIALAQAFHHTDQIPWLDDCSLISMVRIYILCMQCIRTLFNAPTPTYFPLVDYHYYTIIYKYYNRI